MAGLLYISPLNTFRFTPLDEVLPKKYNSKNFDSTSYYDYIYEWENQCPYAYKLQKGDTNGNLIDPQIVHITTNQPYLAKLYLLDSDGEMLNNGSPFSYIGNVPTVMQTPDGTITATQQVHNINLIDDNLEDGIYYLLIKWEYVGVGSGNVPNAMMEFISEPIHLAKEHKGTVLVEYRNNFNKEYMPFEWFDNRISLRVEGRVLDLQPRVNAVLFNDQEGNNKLLSAQANRVWTFFIGGDGALIPEYMIDKLNFVLSLNETFIDGLRYVITENGIEKSNFDNQSKYSASCELTQFERMKGFGFKGTSGKVTVMELIPIDYPYCIYNASLGGNAGIKIALNQIKIIHNLQDLDDYILYANAQSLNQGCTGTFQRNLIGVSDYNVTYTLGAGENYDDFSLVHLEGLLRYLQIDIDDTSNEDVSIGLTSQNSINSKYVISIDTNTLPFQNGVVNNQFVQNNISALGRNKIYLFHNSFAGLSLTGQPILDLKGVVPKGVIFFTVGDADQYENFDVDLIKESNDTLATLRIFNTGCKTFANMTNTVRWDNLRFIDFRFNSFNLAAIETYLFRMFQTHLAGLFVVYNGVFRCENQSPIINLGVNSSISRMNLINTYNWTITNN